MSVDHAGRPDEDDDLAAAYVRAQALADDGRGPSAAVRAGVFAAAAEVAAAARARVAAEAAPSLVPVAPPMAAVGRTRGRAVNLSSWRVRAGAGLCAALLVAVMSWRFDQSGRLHGDVQVALAELRLAAPPTAAPPQELPVPALSAASTPQAPLPTVDDPLARAPAVAAANGKPSVREPDLVIAQADSRERAPLPKADVPAPERRAQPAAATAAPADLAPQAPPLLAASNAPEAPSPRLAMAAPQAPVSSFAPAGSPPFKPSSAMPPSVAGRCYVVSPAAANAASSGETSVAAAQRETRRVDVTAVRPFSSASMSETLLKVSPDLANGLASASAHLLPSPLQSAAECGDVEALSRLLSDPATRVDAPDASGRTALLHAVLAQRVDAVRLLVAAGADPNRADAAGLTPRAAAQTGSNAAITAALGTAPP